jgi:tRNA modification GTPase
MMKRFMNGAGAIAEGLLITNARHHDLLLRAIDAIENSEQSVRSRASEEIVLVGLHNALRFLGQITGETTTEEILGQIFSTFCIGK